MAVLLRYCATLAVAMEAPWLVCAPSLLPPVARCRWRLTWGCLWVQEWQECADGASPALATSGFGPLGLGAEEAAALGGSAGRMVARWTLEERSLKRCAPHAPSSLLAAGC